MADSLIDHAEELHRLHEALYPLAEDSELMRAATELERLSAEVARLQAELEAVRRDALRYRWLREQFTWDNFGQWPPDDPQETIRWVMLFQMSEPLDWNAPVEEWNPQGKLDAAIDAAREG